MKPPLRERNTIAIRIVKKIQSMISNVFNKEFFGVYEAVVEGVDILNGRVDIRVIDLDDLTLTDVRITYPLINSSAIINFPLVRGTHVLVAFRAFKLSQPVIIGQIPESIETTAIDQDRIQIRNGSSEINLWSNGTITLVGTTITANGEDLTTDDKGLL